MAKENEYLFPGDIIDFTSLSEHLGAGYHKVEKELVEHIVAGLLKPARLETLNDFCDLLEQEGAIPKEDFRFYGITPLSPEDLLKLKETIEGKKHKNPEYAFEYRNFEDFRQRLKVEVEGYRAKLASKGISPDMEPPVIWASQEILYRRKMLRFLISEYPATDKLSIDIRKAFETRAQTNDNESSNIIHLNFRRNK